MAIFKKTIWFFYPMTSLCCLILTKQSIQIFEKLQKEKQIDKAHAWVDFSFSFLEDLQGYNTDKSFLNLIAANNPRITGWPIWNVFTNEELRPKVKDGCWEAFINSPGFAKHHIDFWRISPEGYFCKSGKICFNPLKP